MKTKLSPRRSKSSIPTASLNKIKKSTKRRTSRSRTWTRIKAITIESLGKLKTCTCLAAQTLSLKMRIATITVRSMSKRTRVKLRTTMKISRSISWVMKKIRSRMNKCNKTSISK